MLDSKLLKTFIEKQWDEQIIPSLCEYIKIPNKSPAFDADWEKHGYMEQAVTHISKWCETHAPDNMKLQVLRLPGRTPLLLMDVPGSLNQTVMLYGHLDKQPEMEGWDDDLSPWKPVLKNDRLYGRGAADDGYAAYAAITAIRGLQEQKLPHARCIIIIEACEESGSYDLPHYIELVKNQIGEPDLVICLDSGAGNYDQLWLTTSLRGVVNGELSVSLLQEGVHSGYASGIVADSFRVARALISRIEDEKTGDITLKDLHCEIPTQRLAEAANCAEVLGNSIYSSLPLQEQVQPNSSNLTELVLNRTWRPALSLIAASGIPDLQSGGNVLRPKTVLKLSIRIPPIVTPEEASKAIADMLTKQPPYQAKVSFQMDHGSMGWNAPAMQPWLENAVQEASMQFYQKPAIYTGEGGTIPFMGMLGEQFPKAQFVITGVLGPHSNAHGPNEFLELGMAKKVTSCVSYILYQHAIENQHE